jgi:plasmid replication initiation protein
MLKSAYDYQRAITKCQGELVVEYNLIELKLELGIITSGGSKEIRSELEKDYPDYDKIEELAEKTEQTKYKEYKIFNRNVLAKAKEELNKKTSIQVDYAPIKNGRKTVGIRFFVIKKDTSPSSSSKLVKADKDDILDELIDLMHDDFKMKEIREIAEEADYDLDKIKKSYEYMKGYSKTIEVPIAFMKECIRNEYYLQKKAASKARTNSFNNFEQRNEIDFDELERLLREN